MERGLRVHGRPRVTPVRPLKVVVDRAGWDALPLDTRRALVQALTPRHHRRTRRPDQAQRVLTALIR